jgi:hypothetical protein
MSFTAFPIPSVELSTIALDARNAINALENTNAAVNAAIALDTAATYVALDASAGGGGALDADKLAKFQANGTLAVGQSINLSTENATVADDDFIGVSAVATPNQTRKSKFSTVWNYIKAKVESVALTLAGQLQLTGQSITNSSSALTVGLGDTRYGTAYIGIKTESVSSTNTTPIKLTSVTLPVGMYQIDSCIAASSTAIGNGGYLFGLRASSNIRITLFEQYGSDTGNTTNSIAASDATTLSTRDITSTSLLTNKRQLMGLLEVLTNNTEVSLEFCQSSASAVANSTRKRSYIIARKVA